MPTRIFAITAARETVTLDNEGRAEVSFTASNTGSKSIAGRAKLVPLGSAKAAWLNLEGEQERNFAKGEAHQLTVHIAVPPGTAVGKYSFRLNIISVENPDDEFTEGPSVSFEVKELTVAQAPARKFPWWIVAVAAVVVLGAGIIIWLLLPEKVKMPKIVGMPFEEAVNSLNTAKLKIGAKETKITGTQKPGIVVEQNPKAEDNVSAGSQVKLTIEAESVRVPDLRVKTVAQAWIQLNELNLVPKYRDGEDARVSSLLLKVRWQSPEAGALVARGTTVVYSAVPNLVFGVGEKVKVPNLVGVPLEEAVNSLDTAKLKQGAKETKITGTREPGIVLEQSPKAEVDVNAGSEVKLTIEAVSVQVPDLKVKTVAQAWIQLSGLNLVPKYREGEEARVSSLLLEVRWQSPEAGVLVTPGTTVIYSAAP